MGQSSIEVISSAVNNRVAASYPLEKGRLVALSATIPAISVRRPLVYARLSLTLSGDTPQHIIAALAEGHIGSGCDLSWTGNIPLSEGMRVMIETWGRTATIVQLKSITVQDELPV